MLEDRCLLEVTLQIPAETDPNGGVRYRNFPGKALMLESMEWSGETGGGIADRRTFLLRCDETPEIGGRILWEEEIFVIRQLKVCRDLDGRLECYRCTTM